MEHALDAELVMRYRSGERAALDALIRRHLTRVYRFAFRYVRNEHDAEDIAQETFVRMWRHLDQYDPSYQFSTWLLQIAKHAAIDAFRKRARTIPTVDIESLAASGDLIADVRTGDARPLTVALEHLPTNDRLVLILRYQRELTFREIGAALGVPLHTAKSRHRRALVRLRAALGTVT
jgi:RNA polymerase sigma-70 factor (ECF subfamily)